MKEFTVRNKAKQPIMTFTQATLAKMLSSRPESVSLALAKVIQDYKQVTGKTLSLDYEQQQALLAHAGADYRGMWKSRYSQLFLPLYQVKAIFDDGFMLRALSGGVTESLEVAEAFHALLDMQIAAESNL